MKLIRRDKFLCYLFDIILDNTTPSAREIYYNSSTILDRRHDHVICDIFVDWRYIEDETSIN